jgi:hypothetical protein
LGILGAIAGVLMISFVVLELLVEKPLIAFRLFKDRQIALCILGAACAALARSIVTFSTIFFFQGPFR